MAYIIHGKEFTRFRLWGNDGSVLFDSNNVDMLDHIRITIDDLECVEVIIHRMDIFERVTQRFYYDFRDTLKYDTEI